MTLADRVRAALQYLGYPENRINEILDVLARSENGTLNGMAPTPSPVSPTPSMVNATLNADAAHKVNDVFTFTAQHASGHYVIRNFDNLSGDGSSSDRLDLKALFDSLGGKYTDGVNDFADRKAALKLSIGDFDGDGLANDAKLTIDGLKDFSVTFLKPTGGGIGSFHIAPNGSTSYADIVLGGNGTTTVQSPTFAPTPPSSQPAPQPAPAPTPTPAPVTAPSPTPSQPAPQPVPSAPSPGDGLYLGKFPAHYARLTNGVNIERSQIPGVSDQELKLLHDMGVEHIRVMMIPTEFIGAGQTFNPATNPGFQSMMKFIDRANDAGLAVVFSPFGSPYHPSFISNPNDQASINLHVGWMRDIATYLKNNFSPQDVFLELFAEPFMNAGQAAWWKIAAQLASAVRQAAPDLTIIATSNGYNNGQWSFIDTLVMSQPLPINNVVYNVHYYEPMPFTHQGASWVSQFANEYHASYLGVYGFTSNTIDTAFSKLGAWADKYGVYTTVNEFGAIKYAPESGRAQYLNDVRAAAENHDVGWAVWDFDKGFSITEVINGVQTIKDIFQKALTLGAYQDGGVDWQALAQTIHVTDLVQVTDPTSEPSKTASTTNQDQSTPPQTQSTNSSVLYADKGYAVEEKFVFTAADLNKTVTIYNFDNLTQQGGINDHLDLSAVFAALGGKYTDDVNDIADRKAALVITNLNLDSDPWADDVRITIKDVPNFAINLIDPASSSPGAFHIAVSGQGGYDDILIA